jgi:hypothetical protein
MTLVNCKIRNYPLGEPDNQDASNAVVVGSSVDNNTLPSHVKLVIKPDNDPPPSDGYYAVRAANFHIGGRENLGVTWINPNAHDGWFNDGQAWYGTPPAFIYGISESNFFATTSDPAYSEDTVNSFDIPTTSQTGNNAFYGLGFSPFAVDQNSLSIETFGVMGNNSPGRIYHFCGLGSNDGQGAPLADPDDAIGGGYLPDLTTYTCPSPGDSPSGTPPNLDPYSGASVYKKIFLGDVFEPSPDGDMWPPYTPTEDDIILNGGYDKKTSWTYINRIMICDSMELGSPEDLENYPEENEVHVWVEFKDNYALSQSAADNPGAWNIKVDIDGIATFIET